MRTCIPRVFAPNSYVGSNMDPHFLRASNATDVDATYGSVLTQVAVIVKYHGDCAASDGRHLTYFADEGRLPTTWNEGVAVTKGVEVFETVPAEQVKIRLFHAATVVTVRLVGRYYSVSVLLPTTLINQVDRGPRNTGAELAANQLCRNGCPTTEIVDLDSFFQQTARRQEKAKRTTGALGGRTVLPFPVAVQTCVGTVGLSGYPVDSCIFDLLNTGDLSFAQLSAKSALADFRSVLGETGLMMSLNNDSIGATFAEQLKAEAEMTSSADFSLLSTARCRWLIFSRLFFAVVSTVLTVRFTDLAFCTSQNAGPRHWR